MPNIGIPELIVIVMILLVVFGASRLPMLGESVGRAVGKLKRSVDPNPDAEPPPSKDGGASNVEDGEIVDK